LPPKKGNSGGPEKICTGAGNGSGEGAGTKKGEKSSGKQSCFAIICGKKNVNDGTLSPGKAEVAYVWYERDAGGSTLRWQLLYQRESCNRSCLTIEKGESLHLINLEGKTGFRCETLTYSALRKPVKGMPVTTFNAFSTRQPPVETKKGFSSCTRQEWC